MNLKLQNKHIVTVDTDDSNVLKTVCRDVSIELDCVGENPKNWRFIEVRKKLLNLAENNELNAAAIAAPQIGEQLRMFCLSWKHNLDNAFRDNCIVNPIIIDKSEEIIFENESCLSIPEFKIKVGRHSWIEVEFSMPVILMKKSKSGFTFIKDKKRLDGFIARIFQHEIDHLNGKLITDYSENSK